jgi:isocitrate dehydrogenase (NAD+)
MTGHSVTLLPGDGIGPEVISGARRVIDEATTAPITWEVHDIGSSAFQKRGTALPDDAVSSIIRTGVALKGPVATPAVKGSYRSINVALRRPLGLFAQIRPVRSWPGIHTHRDVNVVVARELTEDLTAGIEFNRGTPEALALIEMVATSNERRLDESTAFSLKPTSERATRRFFEWLFTWSQQAGRRRITIAHKATIQRATDGLFVQIGHEVGARWPELKVEDRLVDALCADLVRNPAAFDVIAAPALYGDIISDVAAAVTGGLGLAPGANFGYNVAVFEAAHGTVPKHVGKDRADPIAMVLTGALLLRHIGEHDASNRVSAAVGAVLASGDRLTYDLISGSGSTIVGTTELIDRILDQLKPGVTGHAIPGQGRRNT